MLCSPNPAECGSMSLYPEIWNIRTGRPSPGPSSLLRKFEASLDYMRLSLLLPTPHLQKEKEKKNPTSSPWKGTVGDGLWVSRNKIGVWS